GIEDARGLVRNQGRLGKRALRRNISFGNSPMFESDEVHSPTPALCRPSWAKRTSKIAIGSMMGTFFANARSCRRCVHGCAGRQLLTNPVTERPFQATERSDARP